MVCQPLGKGLETVLQPKADRQPGCVGRKAQNAKANSIFQPRIDCLQRPASRDFVQCVAQLCRFARVTVKLVRILIVGSWIQPTSKQVLGRFGGVFAGAGRVGPEDDRGVTDRAAQAVGAGSLSTSANVGIENFLQRRWLCSSLEAAG